MDTYIHDQGPLVVRADLFITKQEGGVIREIDGYEYNRNSIYAYGGLRNLAKPRVAVCLTHRLRLVGRVLCHHNPIAAQILIMATVAGRIVDMKTL